MPFSKLYILIVLVPFLAAAGIGIVPEESSDLMADLSLYLREKGDGIHQTHPYLGVRLVLLSSVSSQHKYE